MMVNGSSESWTWFFHNSSFSFRSQQKTTLPDALLESFLDLLLSGYSCHSCPHYQHNTFQIFKCFMLKSMKSTKSMSPCVLMRSNKTLDKKNGELEISRLKPWRRSVAISVVARLHPRSCALARSWGRRGYISLSNMTGPCDGVCSPQKVVSEKWSWRQ